MKVKSIGSAPLKRYNWDHAKNRDREGNSNAKPHSVIPILKPTEEPFQYDPTPANSQPRYRDEISVVMSEIFKLKQAMSSMREGHKGETPGAVQSMNEALATFTDEGSTLPVETDIESQEVMNTTDTTVKSTKTKTKTGTVASSKKKLLILENQSRWCSLFMARRIFGLTVTVMFLVATGYIWYRIYQDSKAKNSTLLTSKRCEEQRQAFLDEINSCRTNPKRWIQKLKATYQSDYQLQKCLPKITIHEKKALTALEINELIRQGNKEKWYKMANKHEVLEVQANLKQLGCRSIDDLVSRQIEAFMLMEKADARVTGASGLSEVPEFAGTAEYDVTIEGSQDGKSLAAALMLMDVFMTGNYDYSTMHLMNDMVNSFRTGSLRFITRPDGINKCTITVGADGVDELYAEF